MEKSNKTMQRLQMLDKHVQVDKSPATTTAQKPKKPRGKPVTNIWESMNLDQNLSPQAIQMRKNSANMMEEIYMDLIPHIDATTFPHFIVDKLRALGINGLQIKGYGSPGLRTVEAGAVIYELAKRDLSVATFMIAHNSIGASVVEALGDDEQKARILPAAINFDRILSFGLTEPLNGSDASAL